MTAPNPAYPLWPNAVCGYCDHDASKDPQDPYLYRLTCPECGRSGCDDCMPCGRGCVCPDCEDER